MQGLDCILIRHGEPDCEPNIYLGHTDPHVSVEGAERCRKTAAWCREQWPEFSPRAMYSSALKRAVESAEAVRAIYDIEPQADKNINEIFFGEWEGLPFEAVEEQVPGALQAWFNDPLNKPAPGGETFHHLADRVDVFLAQSLLSPCIIVAHYCSIAVLASRLLGVPLTHADRLALHRGFAGRITDGKMVAWGCPQDV